MKTKLKHIFFASALMAAATNFTACSLVEVNPGEFTMDSLAETEETYEKIVNNCYFAIARFRRQWRQWSREQQLDGDDRGHYGFMDLPA